MISVKEVDDLRFFSDDESTSDRADDVAAQHVVNVDKVVDADHRKVQRKAEVSIAWNLKMRQSKLVLPVTFQVKQNRGNRTL